MKTGLLHELGPLLREGGRVRRSAAGSLARRTVGPVAVPGPLGMGGQDEVVGVGRSDLLAIPVGAPGRSSLHLCSTLSDQSGGVEHPRRGSNFVNGVYASGSSTSTPPPAAEEEDDFEVVGGRDRGGRTGSAAADLAGGRSGGGAGLSGTTAQSVGSGCPTSGQSAMQHPHHANRPRSSSDDSSLRMRGFAHVPRRVQPLYGALTARKWRWFLNPEPCVGGRIKPPNTTFRKQGQSEKPLVGYHL